MEARMQSLAGTMWKLIDASAFDEAGREMPSPLATANGFCMLEAERVIVAVSDGRTALPPDVQSRAFSAYTAGIFLMGLRLSQRLTVHRALGQGSKSVTCS
jgi:hypothetical protein